MGHPFYSPKDISFAAVAQGPGMKDLVTGAYTTNTATKSEANELGPCVFSGNAVNSSTFLSFTDARLASASFMVISMIIKYIGVGQQFFFAWGTNNGLEVVTSTNIMAFIQSNGNVFGNYTLQPNHCYYIIITVTIGTSGILKQYQIFDMNTGAMFTASGAAANALSGVTLMTLLQLNDGNTGGPSRIAAAHVSLSTTVPPITAGNQPFLPNIGSIRAASSNPWSLWYGA